VVQAEALEAAEVPGEALQRKSVDRAMVQRQRLEGSEVREELKRCRTDGSRAWCGASAAPSGEGEGEVPERRQRRGIDSGDAALCTEHWLLAEWSARSCGRICLVLSSRTVRAQGSVGGRHCPLLLLRSEGRRHSAVLLDRSNDAEVNLLGRRLLACAVRVQQAAVEDERGDVSAVESLEFAACAVINAVTLIRYSVAVRM